MSNPFDYVNAINGSKVDIIRGSDNPELSEKLYSPFHINRAMSYHRDTILIANYINAVPHVDHQLQNDYYLNSVRSGKRFAKWHKKEESDDLDVIQEYYQVNYYKAVEITKVLTRQQLDLIKIRITKGGNDVQSKSDGGGQST